MVREKRPVRAAYRGSTSLVVRTLAVRPAFPSPSALLAEVRARGGRITLSTVSKALKALEDDLVVERPPGSGASVRVLSADRLLSRLAEEAPAIRADSMMEPWIGRVELEPAVLLERLSAVAQDSGARVARTGEGSAVAYASLADDPLLSLWCESPPEEVLERLGAPATETLRFPDLRLQPTSDPRAFFDVRDGLAASPVQAWLELQRGDARQQNAAERVRGCILREATEGRASLER